MDVARLNFSHGRPEGHRAVAGWVREEAERLGRAIAIVQDLQGPKIRTGPLAGGEVMLRTGAELVLTSARVPGSERVVSVSSSRLLRVVRRRDTILIDEAMIALQVLESDGVRVRCRVRRGGRLRPLRGIHVPGRSLGGPALTAKDRRDLKEGLAAGVDFVGLSFVRSARHVLDLRRLLLRVPEERRPWVVAKIERREALSDLPAIARAADALMVARGDLGVEIGLARVPAAQRAILRTGRRLSVPVIVATQMLESMMESPVPTRAEVSDVAWAVQEGTDAVMLSGETAAGKYPVEAVEAMAEIARTAEVPAGEPAALPLPEDVPSDFSSVVARTASLAARAARARALIVYTESGRTARLVSKEPVGVPVLAFTSLESVRRRLTLLRDVRSFLIPRARSVEEMVRAGDRVLKRIQELRGAPVVEVSGFALAAGATNTVRVRRLPG